MPYLFQFVLVEHVFEGDRVVSPGPVVTHKVFYVSLAVSSFDTGSSVNKTTACLHQAAVNHSPWRFFAVYLRTREDHILRNFCSGEGTAASPSPGCRAPHFAGQLLMLVVLISFLDLKSSDRL